MFTGIVEELGAVRGREGTRVSVVASWADSLGVGESVAVNGCCLTVVERGTGAFTSDLSPETLARTTLGELVAGDRVNLERPLALGGRLGGHLVQGHVDGVGIVRQPAPALEVEVPAGLGAYLVEKGSVTVDGVSLTVAAMGQGTFRVALVPHTEAVTTLSARRPGDRVNLEVDVVAKYVERLTGPYLVGRLA